MVSGIQMQVKDHQLRRNREFLALVSDSEQEACLAPRLANEDMQFEDMCDDFDSDGTDMASTTLKVMNPV